MDNQIKGLNVFRVKYLGATNRLCSRVAIYNHRQVWHTIIPFGDASDSITTARQYLTKLGFNIVGYGELDSTFDVILSDTFKPLWDYEVQGFYNGAWELLTTESLEFKAKERLKEYRTEAPGTQYRIRKVKIS